MGIAPRKIDPTERLIAEFESRLSAFRVGSSGVIEVSFNSSDPERAAEIVNAIARAHDAPVSAWTLPEGGLKIQVSF